MLYDLDYRGQFRFNHLKQFIKSFEEEEHNTTTKQQDDELFKRIAQQKQQHRQKKQQRKMYKQSIRETAQVQRDLMNINYDSQGKAPHRAAYEANLNRAEDKGFFKQELQSFIRKLKGAQNIEVDVSNSKDLRLAFPESILSFLKNPGNSTLKPVLQLIDLEGQVKYIVLGDRAREHINNILDKINEELTMSQDRWSDDEV